MTALFDRLVKGPIFGCQTCGQCLLSQTSYVCPMTCPKGLRNGPCGGTLNGACEVLPDRACVWLRIHEKGYDENGLHAPFNPELVGTSSVANFFTGKDRSTRVPRPYSRAVDITGGVPSVFAQRFGQGKPVLTYEIASPRKASGLKRVAAIAESIYPYVDGINTTTNAGGVPSLHSLETARVVAKTGIPPIVQFCGRDQGPEEFRRQARDALQDGFANILALTGDWDPATQRELNPERWFPMDSVQMVDILATKKGFIKRPFIGVASTAYLRPMAANIDRLTAKIRAGAHFTQTQIVTDVDTFASWLTHVRASAAGAGIRILASVPIVGKARAYSILQHLPGVVLHEDFERQVGEAKDMAAAGIKAARCLATRLLALDIDGLHLMNFGVPLAAVVDLVSEIREYSPQ